VLVSALLGIPLDLTVLVVDDNSPTAPGTWQTGSQPRIHGYVFFIGHSRMGFAQLPCRYPPCTRQRGRGGAANGRRSFA